MVGFWVLGFGLWSQTHKLNPQINFTHFTFHTRSPQESNRRRNLLARDHDLHFYINIVLARHEHYVPF